MGDVPRACGAQLDSGCESRSRNTRFLRVPGRPTIVSVPVEREVLSGNGRARLSQRENPVRVRHGARDQRGGKATNEVSMSRLALATASLSSALSLVVIGQQASTDLARVQALSLESLPGPVVAYYSPGARDRAASLSSRLSEALTYYDNHLGIAPPVALAVLNEAHWKRVRSSPYGV